MKIYTKKGDSGTTQLIGGTRVPKHHVRIEAYGTVDELNSWVGLLRDEAINNNTKITLIEIQDRLFTLGSLLAEDKEKSKMTLPQLEEKDIEFLEQQIDRMNESLPEMKSFVLPGGNTKVSHCHITRCVCRRAERLTTHTNEIFPINPIILKYLNRLSDYLFVLSRHLNHELKGEEILWKPRV